MDREAVARVFGEPGAFSAGVIGRRLRPYQLAVARAVLDSVWHGRGLTFTVMLARQMGKNELSAHMEAYLLNLCRRRGGTIIKAAPTFRPQAVLSRSRLIEALDLAHKGGAGLGGPYKLHGGYSFELGRARLMLLSGAPEANVVGATANLLLEIDEAQDFSIEKYDRDFRPMGATANVTTVLYGTAWTGDSLLEREKQRNLELERQDGIRRHFEFDWRHLAALSPAYSAYVQGERQRLGPEHPLFLTQYELRTLPEEGRLLSAALRLQLQGEHEVQEGPLPGRVYVAGVDLAGGPLSQMGRGDEATRRLEPGRDSTVLTLAEVGAALTHPSQLPSPAAAGEGHATAVVQGEDNLPTVRVVRHYWWTGRGPAELYGQMLDLLRAWGVRRVAVDATGMGAGLASFLAAALGERVEPVTFTQASKSRLGYELLAAIGQGRLKVYQAAHGASGGLPEWEEFWRQARAARANLRANQTLSFYVPEAEGHDDFLVSLALCLRAAGSQALLPAAATMIEAGDILEEMDSSGF